MSVISSNRSRGSDFTISTLSVITKSDVGRSGINPSVNDTLFYIFDFDDSKGYAIMAADDRTTPIYAIVDNGSFNSNHNSKSNVILSAILKKSADILLNDANVISRGKGPLVPSLPPQRPDEPAIPINMDSVGPLVTVNWGQGFPFNTYCDVDTLSSTTVAMAQIMSYYMYPSYVEWTHNGTTYSSEIDWECILKENKFDWEKEKAQSQIAYLMGYLEHQFVEYDTYFDERYVLSDFAIDWLNNTGYFNLNHFDAFDLNSVRKSIQYGRCSLIRGYVGLGIDDIGFEFYEGEHIWLLDGYLSQYYIEDTIDPIELFHCNWGWDGDMNGYYSSELFSNKSLVIGDSGVNHSNKEFNYYFMTQYSSFKRK